MKNNAKTNLILAFALSLLAACNTAPQQNTVSLKDIEQMTQEQIQALSAEQVDAVIEEADQDLLNTQVIDAEKLQSLAQWPNYYYTLYVATNISYETYLSSYYYKYSGPNWSDDGCSVPIPLPPGMNWIWDNNACRQHDFGYRNVPQYAAGRNETARKSIDERFLSNMRLKCERAYGTWNPLRYACKVDALAFYGAVRKFGDGPYYRTPQRF